MLVVGPVGMTMFVLAVAALRVRAPQFVWPFLAIVAVAAVLVGGAGVPRPYPKKATASSAGVEGLAKMLRVSGFRILGLFLLMMLGLAIFIELAHLLAPYARAWLRS
jgi:hypothetical protein